MQWLVQRFGIWVFVGVFGLASCCPRHFPPQSTAPVSQSDLKLVAAPTLTDSGSATSLDRALTQSLRYLERLAQKSPVHFGTQEFSVADLAHSLREAQAKLKIYGLTPEYFDYLNKNFDFYEAPGADVLFTGYYEASLRGARQRSKQYRYPLYRVPKDILKIDLKSFFAKDSGIEIPRRMRGRATKENVVVPYYTRAEIDQEQKLAGRGLEFVWVDDPVAAFFLHIQGSGVIALAGGGTMRVNYADTNGHPYAPIGKLLKDTGKLDPNAVSMQNIRAYLKANPQEQTEVFNYNKSYIFFREVKVGPIGSLNVPLTEERSVATDPLVYPRGALGFVATKRPTFAADGTQTGTEPYYRLVLNQDTGGAITGPGRADLFTGFGAASELWAGHQKETGRLYFLMLRK